MDEWLNIAGAAVAGGLVTLLGAVVTVYVLIERRLAKLETLNEEYPPKQLRSEMSDLQREMALLRPISKLLMQYGEDAARLAFERGGPK